MITDYNINIYSGNEKYIFICYSHENEDKVYPVLELLSNHGYRIWFDDGLHPGDDWPEIIAQKLEKSYMCITFISPEFSSSHNCRNELNFAVVNKKPLVSIILEDFQLPLGIQLQLATSHIIKLSDYRSYESLFESISLAKGIDECQNGGSLRKVLADFPKPQASGGAYVIPDLGIDEDDEGQETVPMDFSICQNILIKMNNGKSYPVTIQPISIGRSKEKNHICYPSNRKISDVHAVITLSGRYISITDKNSKNGTFINGARISPNIPVTIEKSSVLSFADERLLYVTANDSVDILEKRKAVFFQNIDTGEILLFSGNLLMLGRSHIWKYGTLNDRKISREHAEVSYDGKKYVLKDVSRNGTTVNDKPLEKNKPYVLHHGDIISMGSTTISFNIIDIKG